MAGVRSRALFILKLTKGKKMNVNVFAKEEFLVPECKTEASAGYDIKAPRDIYVGKRIGEVTVDTEMVIDGLANHEQFTIFLLPRSGLSTKLDIRLKNTIGVIDKDYVGPNDRMRAIIKMPLLLWFKHFIFRQPIFKKGDRICQIIFLPVLKPKLHFFDSTSNANENRGGFGSTGLR